LFVLKFTDFGLADVRALPKNVRNSLKKELRNKVAPDPEACSEELHGPLKDYRSFHFRGYRIIYRVFPQLKAVAMVGIGMHSKDARADIYRRLEVLVGRGKIAESVLLSLKGFSAGKPGAANI
jgi:mRNA-degrading endonuclease RelE of RelBE toxin-antitoxin system